MSRGDDAEPLRAGELVGDGRYLLGEVLGRGGLATVLAAHDRVREREVALKVLRVRYVGRAEREERLWRELEYARRVEHPAVIEVYEGGRLEDGRPYFAMERVYGRPLSQVLSGGRLPVERVLRLGRGLAEALAALHREGIVHRDVKPANVLVLDDDRIKLLDLGMAGDENAPAVPVGHAGRLTRVSDLLGTQEYMAPEQVLKAPPHRAMDVFSLGIVLYELLAGLTPYSGMRMREYVALQVEGDPHVRSVARWARLRGAPVELAELIDECRLRDPERRPAGMGVVLERLDRIAASGPMQRALVLAAPQGVLERLRLREMPAIVPTLVASPVELSRSVAPSREGRRAGRRRRERLGFGLGASAAVVLGVWLTGPAAWDGHAESPRAMEEAVDGSTGSLAADVETAAVAVEVPVARPEAEPPASTVEPTVVEPVPSSPWPPVRTQARHRSKAPRRPTPTADCERVRNDAKVAAQRRDWSTTLRTVAEHRCWPEATERARLEVRALAQLQRWDACIAAGRGLDDEVVSDWVRLCISHSRSDSGGA